MITILFFIFDILILRFFHIVNPAINLDHIAIILIVFTTAAVVFDILQDRTISEYRFALITGYSIRIFFLFFDIWGSNIYVLPNSGADAAMFYAGAVRVANGAETGRTVFPIVMGYLFRFIGTTRIFGQYILLICSIVSLYSFGRIISVIGLRQSVRVRAIGILALLPNFAILSVIFLRESIITMFITLSVLCFILWMKKKKIIFFTGALILAFLGSVFHSGVVALVLGYYIVRLIYDNRKEMFRISISNIVLVLLLSLGFIYLYIQYGDFLFGKLLGIEEISDIAKTSEVGGSSYAAYVGNSDSIKNLIRFTLPRMFYFSFSPFPWQWRGINDIIAFLFSSVFYIWAVLVTIKSVISRGRNGILSGVLLIILLSLVFVFGWGTSNVGTAARHRDKMVIIFGILWALGHDESRDKCITIAGHVIL